MDYIYRTLVVDFIDNSVITTSDYFAFYSSREAIIDNIVVSDTVDIEPLLSVPFYMQTWFLASVGVVIVAVVVIVALLTRRK